jgi:glutamate-1-semialdehyde 2,1-aminomutase
MRTAEVARAAGHSGIGTTLSANPLAVAALNACLAHVITAANHDRMELQAARLATGLEAAFKRVHVPWQVSRVGARLEFGRAPAPRTGRQSIDAIDHELEAAMHLYLLNRGFLLTPFHNMMLVSPVTGAAQVDAFLGAFNAALDEFAPLLRDAA